MSNQHFQFDKFVRDLEDRERIARERRETLDRQEDACSNRELYEKYREHLHNRIVVRGDDEN